MFFPTLNTTNSIRIGLIIFSSYLLFNAIFSHHNYGFYIFLRIFIFITCIYNGYILLDISSFWSIRFFILGFVYNPIIKMPLGREIWEFVNIITLLFFIVSLFKVKLSDQK